MHASRLAFACLVALGAAAASSPARAEAPSFDISGEWPPAPSPKLALAHKASAPAGIDATPPSFDAERAWHRKLAVAAHASLPFGPFGTGGLSVEYTPWPALSLAVGAGPTLIATESVMSGATIDVRPWHGVHNAFVLGAGFSVMQALRAARCVLICSTAGQGVGYWATFELGGEWRGQYGLYFRYLAGFGVRADGALGLKAPARWSEAAQVFPYGDFAVGVFLL